MYKLIGISGTNGAGKDTVGRLLVERHGFMFISVTDILRSDLKKHGLPIDREHLRTLSAQWRRTEGLGVLVNKAIELFNSNSRQYDGLALASMRNPGEADEVHSRGGLMVWVDADPRLRYERVQKNLASRSRDTEDKVTFEKFLADEDAEMYHPLDGDAATLSLSDVKAKCDIFIDNDGEEFDELDTKLTKALKL